MTERWVSPKQLLDEAIAALGLPVPIPAEKEEAVLRRIASVSLVGKGSFQVVAKLLGFKQSDEELSRIFDTTSGPLNRPPWAR